MDGTMGSESSEGAAKDEGYFFKVTKDNLDNPTVMKAPVTISNGLAWNKANNKLYYIDSPTRKVVEFVYDDELGVLSKENRTAFDVDLYPGKITGDPDGMTIDEEDNLWICLYGGRVIPLPARDVTSAMWGGPDLDILFVTTSRHSLKENEKLQQPGAGSVFAITNLGTKGLPVFTADIIDSIAKRRNILDNIFNAEIFAPLAKETSSNIIYQPTNEIREFFAPLLSYMEKDKRLYYPYEETEWIKQMTSITAHLSGSSESTAE
ncbi:hypothetical protein NQ315_011084 [Exocentrus adspersus]|uniref:SMP-30/Gluconolactonase/LRE-like region domain-containing protein n=1 Tax=Exocentrus adspersus TaxID=1586481 RepID=A0AAV8VY47_9CUCU|nr:hypothetical protein NQ315_011084 [Exocentrus adspersus]